MVQVGVMSHFKYPGKKGRTYALAAEAKMQGVGFFIFSSYNVDTNKKLIVGETFEDNRWIQKVYSYPDVIINSMSPRNQEERSVEQQLRKEIPFTTNWIGNSKLDVFKKIEKSNELSQYLIPYHLISSTEQILDYIENYKHVVIKPIAGRQGNNIFFLKQIERRYLIKEGSNEKYFTKEEFVSKLKKLLVEKNYFLQPFKQFITSEGNPYDIRVLAQKNGRGQWEIPLMYPRIGSSKGLISNISQGGYISTIDAFMKKEFLDNSVELHEKIQQVALDMVKHINSFFTVSIDELGLDFSIDNNGKLSIFEINTRPQTRFFQLERAKNIIAYARYLTKENPKEKN